MADNFLTKLDKFGTTIVRKLNRLVLGRPSGSSGPELPPNMCVTPASERAEEASATFDKVKSVFLDLDLDIRDVEDNLDQCEHDDERTGVLLRWMNHSSYSDEWKEELPAELLARHLDA